MFENFWMFTPEFKKWECSIGWNRVTAVFKKGTLIKKETLSTEIEYYRNTGKE